MKPTCPARNTVAAVIASSLLTASTFACGPYFDQTILDQPKEALLRAHAASFHEELGRIIKDRAPQKNEDEAGTATANADLADLRAALPDADEEIFTRYAEARANADPNLPDEVPVEFTEYALAAAAWKSGHTNDARTGWIKLLDLPEKQRRYRSTWAAFMIGKTDLDAGQYGSAINWFKRTRDLARQGFADTLQLSDSSLGWEARAHYLKENFFTAIELYLQQYRTGDLTASSSLQIVIGKFLAARDSAALKRAACDPIIRRVITAHCATGNRTGFSPPVKDEVLSWLSAVESTGTVNLEGAENLAWAAYQIGEFELAQRWLKRAPSAAPIAGWIRSKLLLRDGKLDEAAAVLSKVIRHFPSEHEITAKAELALLQLTRSRYIDSLDLLLQANRQTDAAFVAESVLTADELLQYVRVSNLDEDRAEPFRHLLARRLARLGRYREAREFLPVNLRPKLDELVSALAKQDPESLWNAAVILRWYGMALTGTELGPDNFQYGGAYPDRNPSAWLEHATADVRQRVLAHEKEIKPLQRFHYRYRAADLAWDAASKLPDNNDDAALILCEAGTWLKQRDPVAADRFYKALVRRCGETDLGKEADRIRWFPALNGSN